MSTCSSEEFAGVVEDDAVGDVGDGITDEVDAAATGYARDGDDEVDVVSVSASFPGEALLRFRFRVADFAKVSTDARASRFEASRVHADIASMSRL